MSDSAFTEVWAKEMRAMQPAIDWLWQGFLARGNLTLLTGMGKAAGKTTLLSLLLARRKQGGALLGLAVKAGKTAVVTEETAITWAERARRLDLGNEVCFFPRAEAQVILADSRILAYGKHVPWSPEPPST